MPTNLAIDDKLLEAALKVGGHRTKRDTVNEGLREYVQRRKRLQALEAFGTVATGDCLIAAMTLVSEARLLTTDRDFVPVTPYCGLKLLA